VEQHVAAGAGAGRKGVDIDAVMDHRRDRSVHGAGGLVPGDGDDRDSCADGA
jgi:hypothetical protein